MRHVGITAVLVAIVLTVCVVVWLLAEKPVKRAKTLDEFATLTVELDRYLDAHLDAAPPKLTAGLLERYRKRTGRKVPLDAWGQPITFEVSRRADSVTLSLRSAGQDMTWGTPDDLSQQVHFTATPLPRPSNPLP